MSCTLEDVRRDTMIMAKAEFKKNAKSITFQNNTARIAYGPQYRMKDREAAYRVAESNLKRVSKWAESEFGEKFSQGWGTIDTSASDAVLVRLQIPQNLNLAYQIKKSESFNRDINYYMGDWALMQQEEGQMYQLRNEAQAPSDSELDSFLTNLLRDNGIDVNYVEQLKDRKGLNPVAMADLVNKVITVAKGRADITTLPEEAAHFIVEMLQGNKTLFNAMYKLAKDSTVYNEVKTTYGDVYNNNEDMIVKEAMGKILADYVIKRHKSIKDLPTNNQNLIDRIIRWFKSFFKKIDSEELQAKLDDVYGDVANKLMNRQLELDPNTISSEGVFYETDPLTKEILSSINRLIKRAEILDARAANEDDASKAAALRRTADIMREQVGERKDPKASVMAYLDHINSEELSVMRRQVEGFRKDTSKMPFSSSQINRMEEITALNEKNILNLNKILKWDSSFQYIYEDVKKQLEYATTSIAEIKEFLDVINKNKTQELLLKYRAEGSKLDVNDILNSSIGDISYLSRWFGPLRSSSNEVLRMVYNLATNIYNETNRNTLGVGNELLDLQLALEKAGLKASDLHDRDSNGNKTGFLITERKWSEYYEAKSKVKETLIKKFGKESYNDVVISYKEGSLSNEDSKFYRKIWSGFYTKYHKKGLDGSSIANPPINKEFQRLMRNEAFANYYNKVLEVHEKSKAMLPKRFKNGYMQWLLPQIRKDIMQTLKNSENPLFGEIKSRIKENINITEDDIEYGSQEIMLDVNGKVVKNAPIHYTKPIDNKNQLSNDITSMYAAFYEMASNFKALSSRVEDLYVIQRVMGKAKVRPKRLSTDEGVKEGTETRTYEALQDFIEAFFYGQEKKRQYMYLPNGKKVSIGLILDKFRAFVRSNNLFMNIPTMITGHMKGSLDSKIEDVMGTISTQESKWFAEREFDANLHHLMANSGKRKKTSKMEHMFDRFQVHRDSQNIFKRMDLTNRAMRTTSDDILFAGYEFFDTRLKGKLALAIMDNMRLVDGKFMTKAQFDRRTKKDPRKWSEFRDRSLYNAYEYKGGKLVVKPQFKQYVTADVENRVTNIIRERGSVITGMASRFDRTGIYRGAFGRMVMLHRGWMPVMAAERFKKAGINYQTGEVEEGYYRTIAIAVKNFITTRGSLKARFATYNNLSEYEKRNLRKAMTDMLFTAGSMILASIFQGIADDDEEDEWVKQYLAYQFNRLELEQGAYMNPKEIPNILNSPSAALSTYEDIQNLMFSIFDNDEVEYGAYEGMTQREKFLIKRSLIKNLWELPHIKDKNKYIKTQIL